MGDPVGLGYGISDFARYGGKHPMNEQQIEGLPLGTKAKSIKLEGSLFGLNYGSENTMSSATVALEPDNVYGKIDLSLVPIPEGWERLPEDWYLLPRPGDQFLSQDGGWVYTRFSSEPYMSPRIIVRKKATANAYGKDIDSIAIPEGWEKVGFREPLLSEYYISPDFPSTAVQSVLVDGTLRPFEKDKAARGEYVDRRRVIVKRKKKRYIVAKQEVPYNWTPYYFRANITGTSGQCFDDVRVELSIIEE